uniref:Uncharacterized protein n=1 Tax=Anguilla anguilla TaxID=7936 RepID=A0A0E9QEX1_ANGAN
MCFLNMVDMVRYPRRPRSQNTFPRHFQFDHLTLALRHYTDPGNYHWERFRGGKKVILQ